MNYYLDFDSTLYNTPLIVDKMINSIVDSVCKQKDFDKKKLFDECKEEFNNNIYELIEEISEKYGLDKQPIINDLDLSILDGRELVFDDSIPFLEKLKEKGHKLYMLSYSKDSLKYQSLKINGSQLVDYFDAIYITSVPKYELDLDYSNGIFIDDNPKDLLGLYSKNAKKVIRIRRKNNKYSQKDIQNNDIKEYENLSDIPID